jgi:D-serine deaminase-like pyridoxal phosphate-dependent protein
MPSRSPASPGDSLEDIDTPALVLDLDALQRNIARMAEAVKDSGVRLRPHAKSHKCVEIARAQIAAGAVGLCAQKTSEAQALIAGGVADVLVTNEVVGKTKLARLARLAKEAKVAVLADDARNVTELDAAARGERVRLEVLVELDVGAGRCGVAPGEPALMLARSIAACRNLRFGGLHAYHGVAQHQRDPAERRTAIAAAAEQALLTRRLIERNGIACDTVTGAGTGTFLLEAASRVYSEIQPGSYVFMDADYGRNIWEEDWPRFEQSLFILTTVMSTPAASRAVVDAGLKASSVDSGMPLVRDRPGVEYVKASDEHGVLKIGAGAKGPALGEKLLLVPGHCDPTVNLYDRYVCVRNGKVEAMWPVSARGAVY